MGDSLSICVSVKKQPLADDDQEWKVVQESLTKDVAATKQEMAKLREDKELQTQEIAKLREDKELQTQELVSLKQEIGILKTRQEPPGMKEDLVKRQEFDDATKLIKEEHLKKMIKDVVNSEMQQEPAGMKEDLVKRQEFDDATKLIKEEHLKKMIKDLVNSEMQQEPAGVKRQEFDDDLKKLIKDVVNSEMHSICAQEGSTSMKEFSPTRPEDTPEMTRGGDDDHGTPGREDIRQQDFDPPKQYRVVHKDLVYIREDRNPDSAVLGYKSCGDVVLATGEVNDWLKLADEGGWMLKDGQAQGLGLLLEPVAE